MDRLALRWYFEQQAQRPQRLGMIDCCTFAAGALAAGWDLDYSEALGYSDRHSAVQRLRKAGGLKQALCDLFGPMVSVSELKEGDLVYFSSPATVGLILESPVGRYAAVKGHNTIHRAVLEDGLMGWEVPK
jgi:hypothetical protein